MNFEGACSPFDAFPSLDLPVPVQARPREGVVLMQIIDPRVGSVVGSSFDNQHLRNEKGKGTRRENEGKREESAKLMKFYRS